MKIPFIKLNNHYKVPILGLGVYKLENLDECKKIIIHALKNGYRLIDTASYYQNEEAVGEAIIESNIPRKDIFITTKVWCDQISYDGVMKSFNQSLKKLKTSYIDIYLIHWPVGDVFGAWKAMEELYSQGKIKAIGVSNFLNDYLINLISFNKIKPTINQIEMNVFYQRQKEIEFNKKIGTKIQAWSPLARGLNDILENQVLKEIAYKYKKSVAQVILRWITQQNIMVIVKTSKITRLKENIDIFDFNLEYEDFQKISKLDLNKSCFFDQRDVNSIKRLINVKK